MDSLGGRHRGKAKEAGITAYTNVISGALGFAGAVPWKIGDPPPPRGNIVFFNGVGHVAISTGNLVNGESEVMSLWLLPVSGPGEFNSRLQRTTIEDIIAGRTDVIPRYPGGSAHVAIKHGPNPWRRQ
jgi:hypothetical protein